jgi:hypothetical protein
MNNPNPLVPKGSLLEQQSLRRSRLKIAVGCVLAVSVLGLVAMLIQGCKREQPPEPPAVSTDTNPPALAMTNPPAVDTNPPAMLPPMAPTNPVVPPLPPVPPEVTAGAGTDYLVVKGDTLATIAKSHGVTLKALEAANPGLDPKKLKIKQKLTIPASTNAGTTTAAPAGATGATDLGGESYTV